jgi:hypothetical protein
MFVECPHCHGTVEIAELNCAIFRHGVMKATGIQINPHAPKQVCDDLVARGEVYGCGGPFKVEQSSQSGYVAIMCDYV